MTPYRQPIRPGDVGGDVWAVKRAYIKMGLKGAGTLAHTKTAGPAFVTVTKVAQRQHGEKVDGIYGPSTHKVVAPHFDSYGAMLYRTAKLRNPPAPPAPSGDAQALAKRLLDHHRVGRYSADNPGDLRDLVATAAGNAVWSQGGYWVHVHPDPLRMLCWLIEDEKYRVGTFAICSDHHNDGPRGHSGGWAADISSINGVSVSSGAARTLTLSVAEKLHAAAGVLKPWQLICDGYGNMRDSSIENLCIPNPGFYGWSTLQGHRNHIHCGYQ